MPVYEFFPEAGVKFPEGKEFPICVYAAPAANLQEFANASLTLVGISGNVVYGEPREAPGRFNSTQDYPRNVVEISVAGDDGPARRVGKVYGSPEHINKAAIPGG